MQLELEDGTVLVSPSKEVLAEALRRLRVPGCTFAVLEQGSGFYIQTAKDDDGLFQLEFREGSESKHYKVMYRVHVEDVVNAFLSYLAQDNQWRRMYDWKAMEMPT